MEHRGLRDGPSRSRLHVPQPLLKHLRVLLVILRHRVIQRRVTRRSETLRSRVVRVSHILRHITTVAQVIAVVVVGGDGQLDVATEVAGIFEGLLLGGVVAVYAEQLPPAVVPAVAARIVDVAVGCRALRLYLTLDGAIFSLLGVAIADLSINRMCRLYLVYMVFVGLLRQYVVAFVLSNSGCPVLSGGGQ